MSLPVQFPRIPPVDPPAPNKATDAAVRYLLTHDPDALDHLRAILFQAKGNLFLVEDDMSLSQAVRRFMKPWLKAKLARYAGAGPDEILAAARRDEFRHLGRQFKFALIDEIRRRTSARRRAKKALATDNKPHDSPLETAKLQAVLCMRRQQITKLLGEKLYRALMAVCGLDRFERKGDVARAIAAELGVSIQTGRKWQRRLCARMGVRNLLVLLSPSSDNDGESNKVGREGFVL
jgi:hypothetical protein